MIRLIEDKMVFLTACLSLVSFAAVAQDVPSDYQDVLKTLDRKGDFKAGVLKVNIPRSDLRMTIQGVPTRTPFGFGGWIALTKASDGTDVMMGDLVLLQDEVNPVMSALLDNGIDVTALHNHARLLVFMPGNLRNVRLVEQRARGRKRSRRRRRYVTDQVESWLNLAR